MKPVIYFHIISIKHVTHGVLFLVETLYECAMLNKNTLLELETIFAVWVCITRKKTACILHLLSLIICVDANTYLVRYIKLKANHI